MRSEWSVTPRDGERFLAERFGHVSDVVQLRRGLWSSAYSFRVGADRLVVRFGNIREDFDKDAFVGVRAPADMPVPRILEIGEALGAWYAVSRRFPGRHLDALDADAVRRRLPSLLDTLDGVRRIDLSDSSGYGLWTDGAIGAKPSWRAETLEVDRTAPEWGQATAPASLAARAFDIGMPRVRELVEHCPDDRHLVHSDLLHWNVLVENDRVTGMLDWGSSLIGDFVYDIAWLMFWQPWFPQWSGIDFARTASEHYARVGVEVPAFEERLRCYELRIGLGDLNWYLSRHDDVNLARVAERIEELAAASS
ncbi:MAG TPA: aminoglycoside phosphotransferase family protein [Candidatus Limnocylindria bacterium]